MKTPLIRYFLRHDQVNSLFIKHDDYFPFLGGGNKARKFKCLEKDIVNLQANAIVTTGGIQSNHCRVAALLAAKNDWKCTLILHGLEKKFHKQKGNSLIMRMTGAEFRFVEVESISSEMNQAMEDYADSGYKPYYVKGGGHHPSGVKAYIDAVKELNAQCGKGYIPDHIFLASGTGSTQAGILIGLREIGWSHTKVHGISVARTKEKGIQGIIEAIQYFNVKINPEEILFYDDFLFGGYGLTNENLNHFAYELAARNGILLDTTYTAKAFFGMLKIIEMENLTGNIVFWHTGALFNLME